MIKVKANELKDFIIKTTANGLIEDCKLEFKEDGLYMSHKDKAGVVLIIGKLAKKVFPSYETMTLDIKSSETLIKILHSFKDSLINIVKQENVVRFFDENGGFDIVLAEVIDCYYEKGIPEIPYEGSLLVKKSMFTGIIERASIVKSAIVQTVNQNNKLHFIIGEETDKAEVIMPSTYSKDISTTFDFEYFKKLTTNFGLVMDMFIGKDELPSKFVEKTETTNIVYFLTPNSIVDEGTSTTETPSDPSSTPTNEKPSSTQSEESLTTPNPQTH